jgi:uncharacterized caspase-like protein
MQTKTVVPIVLHTVLALAAGFATPAVRADTAVIVGINDYANLPAGRRLLGCLNDAEQMEAALRAQGFTHIVPLQDAQATGSAILDALTQAAGERGRFVFYFAGYGDRFGARGATLLPADALPDSDERDLDRKTLYEKIMAIPASSRTVILDSAFSAAMSRDIDDNRRIRYYDRGKRDGGKDLDEVKEAANGQDANTLVSGGGGICYYAASAGAQQANECNIDGKPQGVFTHFLAARLGAGRQTWGELNTRVCGDVLRFIQTLQAIQTPTLSPGYADLPALGAPDGNAADTHIPMAPARQHTLWDDFNAANVEPAKLTLEMTPNQAIVEVGKELGFEIKAGATGYLVLLEYGTSGNIHLLFPITVDDKGDPPLRHKGSIDSARVEAGKIVTPGKKKKKPNAPGVERLRAILFTSRQEAEALLARFPDNCTLRVDDKDLDEVKVDAATLYTSDLSFEVRK